MPKLVEVLPQHRFDEARLADYIAPYLPDAGGSLQVRQFQGGQSNPTFVLDYGSSRYVLRKKPPGELLPSAHLVDREFRVMRALADTDVPVPKMHHLCQDPAIIGTDFYVMEYLEGRISEDVALSHLSAAERAAWYDAMNATLAALHAVDYAAVGLADFGKPGDYAARQIKRWTKQFQAAEVDPDPPMENLIAWLPEHIPSDDATVIAHGDFRLGNLMFHPTEPRIIAVLDWELATLGHPLADLAYNCLAYRLSDAGEVLTGLVGKDLDALQIPQEPDYVAAYGRRTGRGERIADWPFWLALAAFRLAAICHGVYVRGKQGNAADQKALLYGDAARRLSAAGWEAAQEAG